MAINTTNIPLSFLRGTQSALNNLSSYTEGTFYLTTDTNRLYTAIKKGSGQNERVELQELNQSVQVVNTPTDLSTTNVAVGQFAYITSANILAYYNGTQWIQINPDTVTILDSNTSTTTAANITGVKYVPATGKFVTGTTYYSNNTGTVVVDTTSFENGVTDVSSYYVAVSSNIGAKVTTTLNYTSNVTSTADGVKGTQVDGHIDFPIQFIDGTNIKITPETLTGADAGKAGIKIRANTYDLNETLSGSTYTVKLQTNDGTTTTNDINSIVFTKGNNITFTNTDAVNSKGLTINSNDTKVNSATLSFDRNGALGLSIGSSNDTTNELTGSATSSVTPIIKYGNSADQEAKFLSNNAVLSVYTKGEVDSRISSALQGYNALYYRGAINGTDAFATADTNAHIGDVYIINSNEAFEYPANSGNMWEAGDLVVYNGTAEDANGKISTDLTRVLVPSGNDTLGIQTNKEQADPNNLDNTITVNTYAVTQNGINKRGFRHDGSTNVKVTLSSGSISDQTDQNGNDLPAIITTTSLVWGSFT